MDGKPAGDGAMILVVLDVRGEPQIVLGDAASAAPPGMPSAPPGMPSAPPGMPSAPPGMPSAADKPEAGAG